MLTELKDALKEKAVEHRIREAKAQGKEVQDEDLAVEQVEETGELDSNYVISNVHSRTSYTNNKVNINVEFNLENSVTKEMKLILKKGNDGFLKDDFIGEDIDDQ